MRATFCSFSGVTFIRVCWGRSVGGGRNLLWAGKPSLSSLEKKKTLPALGVCVPAGCSANDVSVVYDGRLQSRSLPAAAHNGCRRGERRYIFPPELNQRAEKQKVNHGGSLGGASDHPDPSAGLLAASTSGGFVGVNARWSVMGRMKAPPPTPKTLESRCPTVSIRTASAEIHLERWKVRPIAFRVVFLRLLHFPHVVDLAFFFFGLTLAVFSFTLTWREVSDESLL